MLPVVSGERGQGEIVETGEERRVGRVVGGAPTSTPVTHQRSHNPHSALSGSLALLLLLLLLGLLLHVLLSLPGARRQNILNGKFEEISPVKAGRGLAFIFFILHLEERRLEREVGRDRG